MANDFDFQFDFLREYDRAFATELDKELQILTNAASPASQSSSPTMVRSSLEMPFEDMIEKYIDPAARNLADKVVRQEPLSDLEVEILIACGFTRCGDLRLHYAASPDSESSSPAQAVSSEQSAKD